MFNQGSEREPVLKILRNKAAYAALVGKSIALRTFLEMRLCGLQNICCRGLAPSSAG